MRLWVVAIGALVLSGCGSAPRQAKTLPVDDLLVQAVQWDDFVRVRQLIKDGKNPMTPDLNGEPAISMAVRQKRLDLVKLMLESKASMQSKDQFDGPMEAAVRANLRQYVLVLLEKKVPVMRLPESKGESALGICARRGDFAMFKLIAQDAKPADLNLLDPKTGTSPLMDVASKPDVGDSLALITWLIKHGADPALKGKDGKSALDLAGENDSPLKDRAHSLILRLIANPAATRAATPSQASK